MSEYVGLKPFTVTGTCALLGANAIAALPAPGVGKEYVIFDAVVTCTDTGNTVILKAAAADFWIFALTTGAMKEAIAPRLPWRTGNNRALSLNLAAAKSVTYAFYVAVDAVKP